MPTWKPPDSEFSSTWTRTNTSLGDYISALIEALADEHPESFHRLKEIVGHRRARVILDEESVDIGFGPEGLVVVQSAGAAAVDGTGATDSATVLALLDGLIEVSDSIWDGRLRVTGTIDAINRMFLAIELLLDASPRTPRLQALAARFHAEKGDRRHLAPPGPSRPPGYPYPSGRTELDLLRQLNLLPEAPGQ